MTTRRFGVWSALAALFASLAYAVPQVLQVAGVLQDPWDRILIFAPSFVLAPCFVLATAAVAAAATPGRQVFALSALAFAGIYAVLASSVYVTQLGLVIPGDLAGHQAEAAVFACCGQHKFTTGLDLTGYTYMSLSTLLAAPALSGKRWLWARRWLVANGLLAPILIGQLAWPWLIYAGALWLVTFPMAMLCLAKGFAASEPIDAGQGAEATGA